MTNTHDNKSCGFLREDATGTAEATLREMTMRWLSWALVAAWLALHGWIWTLLPPVPRLSLPGPVPDSFAFTPDGQSLVTCDATDAIVWDRFTGRREQL